MSPDMGALVREKEEAIRALIASDFTLFPLAGNTKVPPEGLLWKAVKPKQYNVGELMGSNYAVALGPDDLVLDFDPRAFPKGDHVIKRFTDAVGAPLDSFTVKTGGGGAHIYYKVTIPEGMVIVGNLKKAGFPGIDTKHHAGYVVGPGSIHPETGQPYQIVRKSPSQVAQAPQSIHDLVLKPARDPLAEGTGAFIDDEPTRQRYISYLQIAPLSIEGQGGDANAFVVAARGRDFALPADATLELMLTHWDARCQPPWGESELREKVRHAYRYAQGAIGKDHPSAVFTAIPEPDRVSTGERPNVTPPYSRDTVTLVPIDLSTIPEPAPTKMYLDGRLAAGHSNTLYADGGKGKSFIALAIATSVAAGRSFCGLELPTGPTLYLDYELSQEGQAHRAYQIARGLGLKVPPKGLLYLAPTDSLPKLIRQIEQLVQRVKPVLIVIDSMGPAAGGNPEDAKETITLFNAIRLLGVTALILDHQSKMQHGQESRHKTIFGSVYKHNLSRSVLHLERVSSVNGELRLLLRHTKTNFGRFAEDLGLLVRFNGSDVKFDAIDHTTDPAFAKTLTAGDKILAVLRAHGPATAESLVEKTAEVLGTIKNELTRLLKAGKVQKAGQDGRKTLWKPSKTNVTSSRPYRGMTPGRSESGGIEDLPPEEDILAELR